MKEFGFVRVIVEIRPTKGSLNEVALPLVREVLNMAKEKSAEVIDMRIEQIDVQAKVKSPHFCERGETGFPGDE